MKMIHHYFPSFMDELHQIKDIRHQSYVKYPSEELLMLRIFAGMTTIRSMRQMTEEFNCNQFIENIKQLLGEHASTSGDMPYWETINHFLCQVDPADIQHMIHRLIYRLIRMRCFEQSRIKNRYWQVIIDGTHLFTFDEKHCDQCLTRVHNKGMADERVEYYHYVLEAKLYICPELVLTIASEFIEKKSENISKQDCELEAFKRLAKRLKQAFPRLPICLTLDSLYACEPVFALCRQNKWHYMIRFKEGSIPTVATEFETLKALEPAQRLTKTTNDKQQTYVFVSDIVYQDSKLNMIELIETRNQKNDRDKKTTFVFITDLNVTSKNIIQLMHHCRARWCIENEGFNCQKNQGYYLEHLFSKDPIGMKNHYLLIQIAHMLVQLVMFGMSELKQAYNTVHHFRTKLLQTFQWRPLPIDIMEQLKLTIYLPTYIP